MGDVRRRVAAKVILVDRRDRVLLFAGHDPADPSVGRFWFPPGGGVEDGERLEDAACREVREEVGLGLRPEHLGDVVFERRVSFPLEGVRYEHEEHYFLVRLDADGMEVDTSGWTALERRVISSSRWWPAAEIGDSDETIYPEGLGELLAAHGGS